MSTLSETSDNENTVHTAEESLGEEKEEVASVASTSSIQHISRKCPFCVKELQTRHLFNHIRKNHTEELFMCGDVYKIEDMTALVTHTRAFPFTFTLTNDFDENEEHKIYGCLGCNHTFTTMARGNGHCQKKCSTKHIQAIKQVIKEETARLTKKKRLPKKKTVEQFRDLLVLEMRRYKHIQHLSGLINGVIERRLEKKDSSFTPDDLIPNEEAPDFTIPVGINDTQMETLLRKWSKKTVNIDDKFRKLRNKLWDYTHESISQFQCCCAENPDGLYVGSTNHDDLGPRMYPPF